jgi:Kinesin motor domain
VPTHSPRPVTSKSAGQRSARQLTPLPQKPRNNTIVVHAVDRDAVTHTCSTIKIEDPERRRTDKEFAYDNVFTAEDNQEVIYDTTIRPIISRCMEGYNGCIFAYGQTASGKTYSMII